MRGLLASEWLKLRSVRSTAWLLGVAAASVVVAALLTWQGARTWDGLTPARRAAVQPPPVEPVLASLVQLCLAVLGVLAITSEHATGAVQASLVAWPRRRSMLAAKAAVVGAVALAAGVGVELAIHLVGAAIVGGRPIPGFAPPADQEVRAVLGLGLSVAVLALVGLGLGAVLRSTAGAIVAILVLAFALPVAAQLVPAPWGGRLGAVLPTSLPGELAGTGGGATAAAAAIAGGPAASIAVLPPAVALLLLVAYAGAALAAGLVATARWDA